MYGYAKDMRLNLLKMELQQAYKDWEGRINQAELANKQRLNDLFHFYGNRVSIMQGDHDALCARHRKSMQRHAAQLDILMSQLKAAREHEASKKSHEVKP